MKHLRSLRNVWKVCFAIATLTVGLFSAAQPAQASGFGDPHNCEALAQGATAAYNNSTPEPFDAWQIPGSSAFYFTNNYGQSDYVVGCQPAFWEGNFNNANWDGYGNPFQCAELISRYDWLRWHDTSYGSPYIWGDANQDWANHPGHFTQEWNGTDVSPKAGDIIVWTGADHIAVIVGANTQSVTILEQNATYNGGYDFSKRVLSMSRVAADGVYWYTITGGYTWYDQSGNGHYVSSGPEPDGWLH